jgi:endonuclease YncB( thermonuclease family)
MAPPRREFAPVGGTPVYPVQDFTGDTADAIRRVIDGDTIDFNGDTETLRLIGVATHLDGVIGPAC